MPHRRGTKSYGLIEEGGKVAVGAALVLPSGNGNSVGKAAYNLVAGKYPSVEAGIKDLGYNLKQTIPIIGKDANFATKRTMVAAGVGAALLGPQARKLPIVGRVARWGVKVGRRTRLRVA